MSAAHLARHGALPIAGALLLTVSLAACTTGTGGAAAVPTPVGAPASSAPPAPEPSEAPDPGTSGIPASALLQPSDVGGAEPQQLDAGDRGHLRPLRPCGDDKAYPSDDTRTAAVAVSYSAAPGAEGSVPSVVVEFVGKHDRGGAAEQFDDIEAAIKRCPGGLGENERRWTVLDTGVAGDESLLVRIDERFSYADEDPATVSDYAAVARTGDLIVVVTDTGWENIDSSEKLVRDLIGRAVQRAAA